MSVIGVISLLIIVYVVVRSVKKLVKNGTDTQEHVPKTTYDSLKDKCSIADEAACKSLTQKLTKKDTSVQNVARGKIENKLRYNAKTAKSQMQPKEKDAYNEDATDELLTNWEKGIMFSEILSKPKALRK